MPSILLDCSLYELDYWIARAIKFVEERQNKEDKKKRLWLASYSFSFIKSAGIMKRRRRYETTIK